MDIRTIDVRRWLNGLGLEQYADAFIENEISADLLVELGHEGLKELGVSALGHRIRLLKAIETLGESQRATDHMEAERRQITVMFIDIADSTRLSTTLDPEDVREILYAYQQTCTSVIAHYEGHIAQYLGDGVMVYFGWPTAAENGGESAIHAALEIVQKVEKLAVARPLQVRVGIATGDVVVGGAEAHDESRPFNAVGEPPNLAARLQSCAEPGQVVVDATTALLARGRFDMQGPTEDYLKGFEEPVKMYRVVHETAEVDRFLSASAGSVSQLVGRDIEIALLHDRFRRAQMGEGHVVVLCGEAGIGKSRIVYGLREKIAEEDHLALHYQGSPYHRDVALHPILSTLRYAAKLSSCDNDGEKYRRLFRLFQTAGDDAAAVVPVFAMLLEISDEHFERPTLSPTALREAVIDALIRLVRGLAATRTLLIVVEDTHWMDETTRETLAHLVREVRSMRALLVVTHRPDTQHDWLDESHVTFSSLTRLADTNVEAMIRNVAGGKTMPEKVVEDIRAKTDGVPLFVEELTKSLLESGSLIEENDRYVLTAGFHAPALPATLSESLGARLDRLPSARRTAQFGAAIGREFGYEVLSLTLGVNANVLDSQLRELTESGLVTVKGKGSQRRYEFKHALVQDAFYNSMLRPHRTQAHHAIAEALEQLPERDLVSLARHWEEAGSADRAAEYLSEASAKAFEIGVAPREALELGMNALRALGIELPGTESAVQKEIVLKQAEIKTLLGGRSPEFLLDREVGGASDVDRHFELMLNLAPTAHQSSRIDLFTLVTLNALVLTLQRPHGAFSAEVYSMYASVLLGLTGDTKAAARWGKLSIDLCDRVTPRSFARVSFVQLWFIGPWTGPLELCIELANEGERAGVEQNDLLFANNCRGAQVLLWQAAGKPVDEFVDLARENIRKASDGGAFNSIFHMKLEMQFAKALAGRTDGICSLSDDEYDEEKDLRLIVDTGFSSQIGWYYVVKMKLAVHFGRWQEALQWSRKARELYAAFSGWIIEIDLELYSAIATYMAALDDPTYERTALETSLERFDVWADGFAAAFAPRQQFVRALTREPGLEAWHEMAAAARSALYPTDQSVFLEIAARSAHAAGTHTVAEEFGALACNHYRALGYQGKLDYLAAVLSTGHRR